MVIVALIGTAVLMFMSGRFSGFYFGVKNIQNETRKENEIKKENKGE